MRIKIWGARGSIPTPIRPAEVREKIVAALLGLSGIGDNNLREELLSVLLEDSPRSPTPAGAGEEQGTPSPQPALDPDKKRRQVIEKYLDNLSPLAGSTAGGNTPCIEIQSGKDLFIIDAGSGIRELGQTLMKEECGRGRGVIHLFFSHPHWDHIQGFPFFRPAFIPGNKIFIYGVHDMEAVLRRQQEFINFPVSLDYMQADITFIRLKPEEVLDFGDTRVRNICNYHPGDAYAFRFEKGNKVFVYASDASYPAGIDLRPYLNFFAEADLLIYDSQFTQRESDEKEDWGHSSSFVGVEMAQQAKVECLALYHHDPNASDRELEKILEDTLKFQQNQYPMETPVKVIIAQEGQIFDLTPSHTTQLQQVPGGKAIILKPVGIFDEHVANELKEQLLQLQKREGPPQLIIDMSGVEMLQVTGLRALVKLRKDQKNTAMALAGPSVSVQQLIELAGYADFFAIYPSVHVALNALQARETLNLPGQMIKNRYYIEAKIGDGPMGTVFKATDTRLNRPVAVKVLSPSFSEGAIDQFLNQAPSIIKLRHPNIVTTYDCDEDRGLSFMVEEFIESKTLQEIVDDYGDRPLPFSIALGISESIARALAYAHGHGVVHGDLKPQNILLAGEVKVSDFGLGRLESGKALLGADVPPAATTTVRYLAPEQVLGHPIDARTDLYALGVILYELFTGRPPFEGTDEDIPGYYRGGLPRPLRQMNPAISRSLEHLILTLLDKDPNQRYATARQVQRILTGLATLTSGETQAYPFARQRWPALVGRREALARLLELWAETRQGRGQLVFLTGEAGIGKTRLVQELADHLGEATQLVGTCQKQEGSPAYQPFIEALQSYLRAFPAQLASKSPVGRILGQASHFVPEIKQFLPQVGKWAGSGPAEQASLIALLRQATAQQPCLIILDNLQWADQSSLQLLHYLARHCQSLRLMIVAIYREVDLDKNRLLAELLDSQSYPQTGYTRLTLDRLNENEVKELLENIWLQPVPPDLVTAVYHRTEGNPFHVDGIAWGLVNEGVVSWRDDRWFFAPIVEAGLPSRPREAISRRLNRLNKETQTLLQRAAVLGSTFKFEDLHEMSDLSEWDALANIDVALESQLLKGAPGGDMLWFSHTEIQEVLYEGLSPLKRRLLHREAGEALEHSYLPEPEQIATVLAHHFFQAGELEKGLVYSIRAASQAEAVYANHNALFWYTQALDALDQLGIDDMAQQQRFELLLARERIYGPMGERQHQAADLATLQTLAQGLKDPVKQALVHNRQASFDRLANRLNEAATEAQAGLIAAGLANHALLEGESLLQLGWVALRQGQLELARTQMQAAQQLFKGTNDRASEARSLTGLGAAYHALSDYEQAFAYFQQALEIHGAIGNRYGHAACMHHLGLLAQGAGDYTRATLYHEQALELNLVIGDRRGEAICLTSLALLYRDIGYYSLAQTYIQTSVPIYKQFQDEQGEAESLSLLGGVYLATGNYAAARDHAQQALEVFQRLGSRAQEGWGWLELGLALEALGNIPQADDAYGRAEATQREIGFEAAVLDARAGLARCLLASGKTKAAKQEVDACLAWLKDHGTPGVRYPVRLYLTAYWVFQAVGRSREAAEALQEGYTLLQQRAGHIDSPELKAMFLKNVPENKELSIQFARYHQGEESGD